MSGTDRAASHCRSSRRLLASLVLLAAAASGWAEVPETAYSALRWRLAGPFRGGWATAVAGIPGNSSTFYFGSADGGVWKTTDAGVTWQPLFSEQGSASIGALAVAPSNPSVLWVGTGQVHQRWDIVDGDGVYRSSDGGASWTHVGLADTRHIGSIWVDPRDANVAVVAALGHVFGPNEERGLFRTEDGGRTWTKVLYKDADTGAVDIAGDAATPDVLYAALWQVRRHPWLDYFQPPIGPGSGIYKSTDGGRSWAAVGGKGWPTVPVGRIDLAVASGTSGRGVLALVDSEAAGGLYRSDDAGASWTRVNPDAGLASSYTNEVVTDPRDPEIVWVTGRSLHRSTDGGRTFSIFKGSPGGDDYHCLWIDPTEPRRMITGADQGAVVSLNGGGSWSSWYNQPTGQFYRLATDDRFPYWIYSGQQDSGTVALASRSDYGQLTFRDWHPVGGDERDGDVPDPRDPDIVYGAGLGGRLSKWNARTGQVQNVSPWPVASYAERPTSVRYRYSWITPLAISKRPPYAIYQGAQVVFRSTDGGHSWRTLSPDLTGAVAGAPDCDGDVPLARATACGFGVVFAITPSPAADGVVWVGTDNGRVQLTRDDGASWSNVTPPDMQDWTKVNLIDASASDAGTAYVAVDRHRADDRRPLAWRTHDFGRTWTEIGHGLPRGAWVGVVRQDPKRPGLLFAGTSRGVQVSFDDGDHWQSLQLGLPRTGINDLLVKGDDLIAATQGRGIWILDGIEPLRHLPAAGGVAEALLIPPAPAYRLRPNENKDTPLPPEEPRAPNPPVGAFVDYVLPAAPRSPVVIEIVGPDGVTLRRFASDAAPPRPSAEVYFADRWLAPPAVPTAHAGHNRFVWDLRYPAPRAIKAEYSIAAVPGGATTTPAGAFVLPGRYEVRLTVDGRTFRQPLEVLMDPRVDASRADLEALLAFQQEVAAQLGRSADLAETLAGTRKQLQKAGAAAGTAAARADAEAALTDLEALASGPDQAPEKRNAALTSLAQDLETSCAAPTVPQRELLTESRAALDAFEAAWARFEKGHPAVGVRP
jgi:photosystem II stability/assembly factor-like uncharacterized protein